MSGRQQRGPGPWRLLAVGIVLALVLSACGLRDRDSRDGSGEGGDDTEQPNDVSELLPPVDGDIEALEPGPGDSQVTTNVDSLERTYWVHVPPSRQAGADEPLPLVINFHPFSQTGGAQAVISGMREVADRENFVVVFPDGIAESWNAGGLCCGRAAREGIDDIAFVRRILDEVQDANAIDPTRIFATGYSNGAIMAHRLACEPDMPFAAIAPVAGSPMRRQDCDPERPVAMIKFHGTQDRAVRYGEGRIFVSVEDATDLWVGFNECREEATDDLPDVDGGDGTTVQRTVYSDCSPAWAEVELYTIEGGGHTWPGMPFGSRLLGPISKDIDASDVMWEFFARHPRS